MPFTPRAANPDDAEAIAGIYNEGIEDRVGTFEVEPRSAEDVLGWIEAGYPIIVSEDGAGQIVAWASASPYRPNRAAYSGVAEFSIYVARVARGQGAGSVTLAALISEAEGRGYWKLVSRIFPENEGSLALCRSLGFREVGVYRRHARLDGMWRDVAIVERLLGEAAD